MRLHTGNQGPLYIVMNAGSGHNDTEQARETMRQVFRAHERAHEFLLLEDARDLPRQAARAVRLAKQNQGIVVAAGGDGTLNGVAHAVIGQGVTFGVLPQGTFNLFGRVHGIPQDTEAQAVALLHSEVTQVQVGMVNDRVFLVNASVGLYPQILQDREQFKQRYGRSRAIAVVAGLVTLARHRKQLTLDVEDERGTLTSLRTPTLFVGNNKLQLERIGIHEADVLDRGRLAGIVVRPIRGRHMFGLALRGALGALGDADHVQGFGFRKLTVHLRQSAIKIATDGEIAWLPSPLTFRVAPDALQLLVPDAAHRAPIE